MQHPLFILQETRQTQKKELDIMERNGVIKRIEEPADWAN